MLDPDALYAVAPDAPALDRPVLVHVLDGFIDAGGAGRLAREHLLATLEHRVVATFDVDQLHDYRARRPVMTFVEDHWESVDAPRLELSVVEDASGTPFLLLGGPEPDVQWERFTRAVARVVERFGVRTVVGLHGIPMAVPHSRPTALTAHATRQELVSGYAPWLETVQVPGSIGALLELRLGQAGHDAMGFAVHVPHYVAQSDYPAAAEALLDATARATGLALPTDALRERAAGTRRAIDEQVGESEEVAAVVRALEEQYDAFVRATGRDLLAGEAAPLPSGDELGAELERFLADQERRDSRDT